MLSFSLVAEALTGLIYHRPSGENSKFLPSRPSTQLLQGVRLTEKEWKVSVCKGFSKNQSHTPPKYSAERIMILVSILEIFEYKWGRLVSLYTKWHSFEMSEPHQTIYFDEVQNQLNKDIDFPILQNMIKWKYFGWWPQRTMKDFATKRGFLQGQSIIGWMMFWDAKEDEGMSILRQNHSSLP